MKLVSLLLATSVWFTIASEQQMERVVSALVRYTNVPPDSSVLSPRDAKVSVRAVGLRREMARLDGQSVEVRLDLSQLSPGVHAVSLEAEQVVAPPGVSILEVEPASIRVELRGTTRNGETDQ